MSDATKRIHRQHLRDIAAAADAEEGIRQGLEDIRKGKVRPVREFLKEFEANYGIPKSGSGGSQAR
jgi:hypothetical protein